VPTHTKMKKVTFYGKAPSDPCPSCTLVNFSDFSISELAKVMGSWSKTLKVTPMGLGIYPPVVEEKEPWKAARAMAIEAYGCVASSPTLCECTALVVGSERVSALATPREVWQQNRGAKVTARYAVACAYGPAEDQCFSVQYTWTGRVRQEPRTPSATLTLWEDVFDADERATRKASTLPLLLMATSLLYGSNVLQAHQEDLLEVHITVQVDNDSEEERFRTLCVSGLGEKCVAIQLPAGAKHARQPMLSYYHRGHIMSCLCEMYQRYGDRIGREGFHVTRLKVELQLSSDTHVPTDSIMPPNSDAVAQRFLCNYYEFHIKVRLLASQGIDAQRRLLQEVGQRHHAHVSRNAFKKESSTGDEVRFLTLRMYGIARDKSFELFNQCVEDVRKAGLDIASMQREYSVYDSNVSMDAGWMEAIPNSPGAFRTIPEPKNVHTF